MSLSKEQQAAYEAYSKRLGIDPNQVVPQRKSASKVTVLSSDPSESTHPPKIIPVASLKEMNAVIGVDDNANDDHVEYHKLSKSLPVNASRSSLSSSDIHELKKVAQSYLHGNPAKIAASDVASVDAALFPTKVAAFSFPDVTIAPGEVLVIKAGVMANYGILTVEAGGLIKVEGDSTLNCQQFIAK